MKKIKSGLVTDIIFWAIGAFIYAFFLMFKKVFKLATKGLNKEKLSLLKILTFSK